MPQKKKSADEQVEEVFETPVSLTEVEDPEGIEEQPSSTTEEPVVVPSAPATAKAPAKKLAAPKVEEVEEASNGARMVRVRFVKDHTFNIGTETFSYKAGDTAKVELHLANLFSQRNIAYIL
jgi:hypothetical protein